MVTAAVGQIALLRAVRKVHRPHVLLPKVGVGMAEVHDEAAAAERAEQFGACEGRGSRLLPDRRRARGGKDRQHERESQAHILTRRSPRSTSMRSRIVVIARTAGCAVSPPG